MFSNLNDNINYSEYIATELFAFSSNEVKELTPPSEATKAVLQFYTDEAGIRLIGETQISYVPIVAISQSDNNPEQGYKGNGFKIPNLNYHTVKGLKNIAKTKFIPFNSGYDVFCVVQYYK